MAGVSGSPSNGTEKQHRRQGGYRGILRDGSGSTVSGRVRVSLFSFGDGDERDTPGTVSGAREPRENTRRGKLMPDGTSIGQRAPTTQARPIWGPWRGSLHRSNVAHGQRRTPRGWSAWARKNPARVEAPAGLVRWIVRSQPSRGVERRSFSPRSPMEGENRVDRHSTGPYQHRQRRGRR